MISNEQRIERLKKLSNILKVMPECSSIGEISEKTKIPTSTIQRYLNNKKLFVELFLEEEKIDSNFENGISVYEQVQSFLKDSKKAGLSKGGIKSQQLYGYSKDEDGKFQGKGKN